MTDNRKIYIKILKNTNKKQIKQTIEQKTIQKTKTNHNKVGTGTLQESLDMGFREEGALELRSSTEELYFMDPVHKKEEEAKLQQLLQQVSKKQVKFHSDK